MERNKRTKQRKERGGKKRDRRVIKKTNWETQRLREKNMKRKFQIVQQRECKVGDIKKKWNWEGCRDRNPLSLLSVDASITAWLSLTGCFYRTSWNILRSLSKQDPQLKPNLVLWAIQTFYGCSNLSIHNLEEKWIVHPLWINSLSPKTLIQNWLSNLFNVKMELREMEVGISVLKNHSCGKCYISLSLCMFSDIITQNIK